VKSITVCAKEASAVHYLVRCTLQRSPSQLGGKIPLSCMHCLSFLPGVNRNSSCRFPKAPNGVLLTTGSVAQSPGEPCPRLTLSLVSCFGWLVGNVQKINHTKQGDYMHLTSFGLPTFGVPLHANPTTNTTSDAIDADESRDGPE